MLRYTFTLAFTVFAIVAASEKPPAKNAAGNTMTFSNKLPSKPTSASRNLGTAPVNNLGQSSVIPTTARVGDEITLLRLDLDVPQQVQLTLSAFDSAGGPLVAPAIDWSGIFHAAGVRFKVEWGAGGSQPVAIEVDADRGVSLPLHCSTLRVTARVLAPPTSDVRVLAFVGGGSHPTQAVLSRGEQLLGGASTEYLIPAFARKVAVTLGAAQGSVEFIDVNGTVVATGEISPGVPLPFYIPGGSKTLRVTNGSAAAVRVGVTFILET